MTLEELEQFVIDEIASYRYKASGVELSQPLSVEKVERLLAEMRAALVKPEWHMVDTPNTHAVARGLAEPRRCALVADDGEFQLYYDPVEAEFMLATASSSSTTTRSRPSSCWRRGIRRRRSESTVMRSAA